MNRIRKTGVLLAAGVLALGLLSVPVNAESYSVDGHCEFNGRDIVSDFDTGVLVKAIENLQPGDDVSFTVSYTNAYSEATDWYMSNEVLQTLEKTAASKKVAGLGTARGGGYKYKLIHYDKNRKPEVLFGEENVDTGLEGVVGGEATPGNLEGLEQATNALDEWFFIQTLEAGESGIVELQVAFDGETEVNDYMDTDGGLAVRFAVEVTEPTVTNIVNQPRTPDTTKTPNTKKLTVTGVDTGDSTQLGIFIGVLAAGVVMLIVLLVMKRRKDDKTGGDT